MTNQDFSLCMKKILVLSVHESSYEEETSLPSGSLECRAPDSSHACIFSTIISAFRVSGLNTSTGRCLLHTLSANKFLTFVFKVFNTTIIQLHPFPCNVVLTLSLVHVTLSS